MKLKTLTTAMILATVPMTGAFAAAMDRSGQSIAAFLQPGNYFEAGISVLDPSVSGQEAGEAPARRNINDMAGDYYFPSAALKLQPTSKFSFGILYDQPFGADAEYTGNNSFVSQPTDTILPPALLDNLVLQQVETTLNSLTSQQLVGLAAQGLVAQQGITPDNPAYNATVAATAAGIITQAGGNVDAAAAAVRPQVQAGALAQGQAQLAETLENIPLGVGNTKVDVSTQNLTFLFGYQPTENWNIYAGPVYQTVKGNLSLRGQAYSIFNGYDATMKETGDLGWLAGLAYQIPEIALKASLTYRSEIDHEADTTERLSAAAGLALIGVNPADIVGTQGTTKITTPQSVNLDFQTGIMANTVAFANVRWVEWSKFAIRPYQFGLASEAVGQLAAVNRPNGFNLVEYSDDQISATAGVGRKFNDLWAGNVSVGWDSGAGNPVSTLGPTEGYWNVGLGVQYSPTPATFIGGGVKYFWLGDAKSQTAAQVGEDNRIVGDFSDNHAIAYGLKMGYRF
ncbi:MULTISPECIES: OmpP1/FadL family transporter [Acinetobacter]|uniref:OmpP1/FadL family transporter n=1 Tax=Acinetobacter TaxID=469 RepID=UPI000C24EF7A|nr:MULTISPECIES: outer membrane protein transport protein [Acinetobacter]MCP0911926.1 outer membrane protein transport protein [Acinetobacter pseudolwoffii]PJI36530.1 long-chain fatty acid transporter [Acinetobacter pseudolwoffii]